MSVTDFLTQAQLQEMMNQRFGVPEGTARSSPLSFQYEQEEYPSSYGKSQLYYNREGPFSDKRQVADPDAYYNQVRTIGTPGDPFIGARDYVDAPFAKQSPDYYAADYINYDETTDRPYQGNWDWEHGYRPDDLKGLREYDPRLMQALINQKNNLYEPLNERDKVGIKTSEAVNNIKTPPFQDFSFSKYQGPSVGEEAGNIYEQQKDEPWYSAITNMFKRPPAKQAEFEAYEKSMDPQGWGDFGDYRGNIYQDPGTGLNRIDVVDPRTGVTILRNKNFDSIFGSDSVEEMISKKEAWARARRAKNKGLSSKMNAWLDRLDADKAAAGTGTGTGPGTAPAYQGPRTYDYDPRGPTQASIRRDRPDKSGQGHSAGFTNPGKGSYGPHKAEGGYMRRGYSRGGKVGILSVL